MKLTINTDVLSKENLTLGEFLLLLMNHYGEDYSTCFDKLVKAGLIEPNLFKAMSAVLSNNTKNLIAKILMESDERAVKSGIDFDSLADKLRECYPEGIKPGTTYEWKGKTEEIAQKLRTLVVKYDFAFTEEEAIAAVREYVGTFKGYMYMQLLRNFILNTRKDSDGRIEIESLFMTIIENNREGNENSN